MPRTNYQRGADRERYVQKELEKYGYRTIRSAGSHGDWDVIAYNGIGFRLIQIKYFQKHTSIPAVVREQLEEIRVPPNTSKEWWSYAKGDTTPRITVIP